MAVKWRIHYENGQTFSNEEGLPWEAPVFGVLFIGQTAPERPLFNKDYYLWRNDYACWIECDLVGLLDHLTHNAREISAVLLGRTIPSERFESELKLLQEYNV